MKNPDIKSMFDTIAGGYDFQNRFLSLWIDMWWRKRMVNSLEQNNAGLILDMATGTAEIAMKIAQRRPRTKVFGGDFSPNMLRIGMRKVQKRGLANRIKMFIADARRLPFREAQFDAVTIAFGIRNIKEREKTLKEFYTVLKPGGQIIIMEFGFPRAPLVGRLYQFYFNRILPRVGDTISRTGYAYTYLADSVHAFPKEKVFVKMMEEAGFRGVRIRKLTLGIAVLFTAEK
ncbi:MAG: bifunctional demethylmenaquinone methyltransferase/2-methoxy-6-polyprenyl-1,4-benzoquinol methylase UbiE [Deltaproteobacteria bacterium]|nr:bifunctional demethylmenaquinone methyltransferase/2-methoxy-6-polyprenyl-1,4-benzoquinol methylase UbiE [Deltaproteobacteria bacterium]